MSAIPNHALRQLRAGKLAVGLGVRNARTVDIAQIAKTAGFDLGQAGDAAANISGHAKARRILLVELPIQTLIRFSYALDSASHPQAAQ